ncbi:MAG: hypothetical protein V1721_03220 [Pseudomonadota bacterium]
MFHAILLMDGLIVTIQHYSSPDAPDVGNIYVPRSLIRQVSTGRRQTKSSDVDTSEADMSDATSSEKLDMFVRGLDNQALVSFIKQWQESGKKISWSPRMRLAFPQQVEKWRIEPREKGEAWVQQGGRFNGDEDYWKEGLSLEDKVEVRGGGKCLRFYLESKSDFDFFWQSITEKLKDIAFTHKRDMPN